MWTAAAVAAVAAAAQLGVASVLGIIRWNGADGPRSTAGTGAATAPLGAADWSVLLTWVGFSFAVAVFAGALAGRRTVRRATSADGIGTRITATLLAAVGASTAVLLAWLPAQEAKPPVRVHPELMVAATAGIGIAVGIVIALIALSLPPVAVGLRASVAWLWLLGIGCAVAGVVTHRPFPAPRLGVLDAPSVVPVTFWTGPRLMIGIAVLIGLIVAGTARAYGAGRFGVALAGLGGPAVVAGAYLVAGPDGGAAQYEPYLAALIATGAGLIASVLVAMPGRRGSKPERPTIDVGSLRALSGDVVSPAPGFAMAGPPPTSWDDSIEYGAPYGVDEPRPSRRPTLTNQAMDYITAEHPVVPVQASRHADPVDTGSRGSVYTGTTYGSRAAAESVSPARPAESVSPAWPAESVSPARPGESVSPAGPIMGQPPVDELDNDPHASWLRDLGSPGRHSIR
jgi:hypothetical protein